jgi:hypothetical protein
VLYFYEWNISNGKAVHTQDCEQDVDQEVGTAASLEEDTNRGQEDGKNDLADIAE